MVPNKQAQTLREEAALRASRIASHEDDNDSDDGLLYEAVTSAPHPLVVGGAPAAPTTTTATSARTEWRQHGEALTQALEEKRSSGALRVRVISAQTRNDVAGNSYTAYIIKIDFKNESDQSQQQFDQEHRYSDFCKLNTLVSRYKSVDVAFPSKHWAGRVGNWTPSKRFAPEKHDELVSYRTIQLDVWLVHIVDLYNRQLLPNEAAKAVYDFLFQPPTAPCNSENTASESWKWNNPLSFTLGSTIRQATATMQYMTNSKTDQSIPLDLLQSAKGLCFMTVVKAGLVVSGRVGTGLVVQRLADGSWSAPCAVGTLGMGWGALVGGDVTHYLIILTTTKAVQDMVSGKSVTLGAELGVAVGPVGRGAQSHLASGDWTLHPAYAYAHSQGFFVGMSLEGSIVSVRHDVNAKFYGQNTSPTSLLLQAGPKAAEPLYAELNKAMSLEIPDGAFRPSQLFQQTSPPNLCATPTSYPQVSPENSQQIPHALPNIQYRPNTNGADPPTGY